MDIQREGDQSLVVLPPERANGHTFIAFYRSDGEDLDIPVFLETVKHLGATNISPVFSPYDTRYEFFVSGRRVLLIDDTLNGSCVVGSEDDEEMLQSIMNALKKTD